MHPSKNCATVRHATSKLHHTTGKVISLSMNDDRPTRRPTPHALCLKPPGIARARYGPRPTISLRAPRPDSVGQYTNLLPPTQQKHFKRNGSVSTDAQYIRVELLPRTSCSNQNGSRAPPE